MAKHPGQDLKNLKREHSNLGLVITVYAQLVEIENSSDQGRHLEVHQISAECKTMAMEMDTVMLLLALVNRSIETRQEKGPQLNDLCESGSSEQDAEVVATLNRPAYYGEETDFPRRIHYSESP